MRLGMGVIVPVEARFSVLIVVAAGDDVGVAVGELEGNGLVVKVGVRLGVSVGVNVELVVPVWGMNGVGNGGSSGKSRVSVGAAVGVTVEVSNKSSTGFISAGNRQPVSKDQNSKTNRTVRLCKRPLHS